MVNNSWHWRFFLLSKVYSSSCSSCVSCSLALLFFKNFCLCCPKDHFSLASVAFSNLLGPFLGSIQNGRVDQGLTLTRVSTKVTGMKPAGNLRLDFREQFSFQCVSTTLETQRVLNGGIQQFSFKRKMPRDSRLIAHIFCHNIRMLAVNVCSVPL